MIFGQIKYAVTSCTAIGFFLLSSSAIAIDPNAEAREALKARPDAIGALKLTRGNGPIFCTLGRNVDGQMSADKDRTAVLYFPEFNAWHGRGKATRYAEVGTHLKDIVASMENGRCNVAVESASNIIALAEELKRLGTVFRLFPSPLSPAQLADVYANSLGFGSNADLLLATHMRANNDELQSFYKLGITSKSAYDDAIARMRSQGYGQEPARLQDFLRDEAEGARRNLPAIEIRDERRSSASFRMQQ